MGEIKEVISDVSTFDKKLYESTRESHKGGILRILSGPVAEWDKLNRNNRKYSKELWDKVLESPYVKEQLAYKTLYGEAGHPTDRMEVDFGRVSHSILDLWEVPDRSQVYAKIAILDTPLGRILNTLYEAGGTIGYSSRAGGSLMKRQGYVEVDSNKYSFVTFDAVPFPSVVAARPEEVNESYIQKEPLSDEIHNRLCSIIKESTDTNRDIIKSFIYSLRGYDLDKEKSLLESAEQNYSVVQDYSDNKDTVALLKESSLHIKSLEAEKSILKAKYSNLEKEKEAIQQNLSESLLKISELAKMQSNSQKIDENVQSQKNTIQMLKEQISQLTDELEDKDAELSRLQDVQEAVKTLKYQNRAIRFHSRDSQEALEKIKGLQEEKENLTKKLDESYSEISKMIEESDSSKDSDREVERLNEEVDSLNIIIDSLNKKVNKLSANLKESKEKIQNLDNQTGDFEKLSKENARLKSRIMKAKKENRELNESMQDIRRLSRKNREDLLEVICDSYGLKKSLVESKLSAGASKDDIYAVCESISNNSPTGSLVVDEVSSVNESDNRIRTKVTENPAPKPRVSYLFEGLSRRGIN